MKKLTVIPKLSTVMFFALGCSVAVSSLLVGACGIDEEIHTDEELQRGPEARDLLKRRFSESCGADILYDGDVIGSIWAKGAGASHPVARRRAADYVENCWDEFVKGKMFSKRCWTENGNSLYGMVGGELDSRKTLRLQTRDRVQVKCGRISAKSKWISGEIGKGMVYPDDDDNMMVLVKATMENRSNKFFTFDGPSVFTIHDNKLVHAKGRKAVEGCGGTYKTYENFHYSVYRGIPGSLKRKSYESCVGGKPDVQ